MLRYLSRSLLLLGLTVLVCCVVYPLVVWAIGRAFFPFQANGSLLKGPDGTIVGSKLIGHNAVAQAWVNADPTHGQYVDTWSKAHPDLVAKWIKDNPATPQPKAADLAVLFFENFSNDHPGMFPSAVTQTGADGKSQTSIQPVKDGTDTSRLMRSVIVSTTQHLKTAGRQSGLKVWDGRLARLFCSRADGRDAHPTLWQHAEVPTSWGQ
jgi:K+-transporting ATPase, c chain